MRFSKSPVTPFVRVLFVCAALVWSACGSERVNGTPAQSPPLVSPPGDDRAADGSEEDLKTEDEESESGVPPLPAWALEEDGAFRAPDEVLTHAHGLGSQVRDASHDAGGNLWAVDGAKVYVRRARAGAFEAFGAGDGLTGQEILSVAGTVAGTAWVGYRGQGDDAEGEPVAWRGTGGVGRVELSGADVRVDNKLLVSPPGRFPKYPDGRYKLRTCIRAYGVKDGRYAGEAWFGCNHGVGFVGMTYGVEEHHHPILCLWNPAEQRCTEKSGWVGAVAFTPEGDVWMGGSYGVMLLDYDNDGLDAGHFWGPEPVHNESLFASPLEPNAYGSEDIVALTVAPDDTLWAASSHSGLAHRHSDGTVDIHQELDGLVSNRLSDIAATPDGYLWLGTEAQGIVRLELSTGKWQRAAGVPAGAVRRLVYDRTALGGRVTAVVSGAVLIWNEPSAP